MNTSIVSRVVSLIPERVARLQSGTLFMLPDAGSGTHGTQVAHLVGFLQWLSPLSAITKEDQRVLGLLSPHARPSRPVEEDELEGEVEHVGEARSLLS